MTHPLSEEALSRGENLMFDCPPSASDEASSGKQGPTSQQAAMVEASAESALNALDQIADQWAVEIDLLSCVAGVALSPMLADSVEAFSRQCFIEGAYRGFLAGREFSPSENSVSDEQPMAEDAQAAEPEGCQRGGEAETPHPLPADHAERLYDLANNTRYDIQPSVRIALSHAATLITSQAEEIEILKALLAHDASGFNAQIKALQSDIERITKERDEANESYLRIAKLHSTLKAEAAEQFDQWQAAESSLASMTARCKGLETALTEIATGYLADSTDFWMQQTAYAALSQTKGTDDA